MQGYNPADQVGSIRWLGPKLLCKKTMLKTTSIDRTTRIVKLNRRVFRFVL